MQPIVMEWVICPISLWNAGGKKAANGILKPLTRDRRK